MNSAAGLKLLATLTAGAVVGAALASARAEAPAPFTYRRVYVPEEALEGQIRGLLPLKREDFERRLTLAETLLEPATSRSTARIDEAVFRARLEDNQLYEGTMELTVTATANEAALLTLEPCNVVLESAVWKSDSHRAGVFGVDPSGMVRCLVERSGTLALAWTKSGLRGSAGEVTFDLQLPAALRRRLEITAPVNVELSVNAGLITRGQPTAQSPDKRLWTIELGGQPQIVLHAQPAQPQQDARPLVTVRELSSYTVLRSTLDLETTLTLDILRQPLKGFELEFDRPLQLTAVRLGERNLEFQVLDHAEAGHPTAVVELPMEWAGLERVIEVTATADWPAEGRATLPRVRLVGGVLQEGKAEIHAPAWLRLQAKPLGGCVQVHCLPAATGRGNDRFEFQLFEPQAVIEIAPDQTAPPLDEQSGTQITVEASQITGVLVAELTSLGGSRFAVDAHLPRQWIVDAVETQPLEMLADRTLTTRGSGPQLLHVKLSRALTAQRPLRLVIRAHYRRPANNRPLESDFFRLVAFPEVRSGRRLVSVRVNDPGSFLRLAGDEDVTRLNPTQLSPAELGLFEAPPGPLLFAAGAESEKLRATLEAATARFRASVLVRAAAERDALVQTVTVRCQPDSSAVGSLVVRLAPRPRGDIIWRLVGEQSRELVAVLENQANANAPVDEAAYRLILPRPQSFAFEVTGQWSAPQAAGGEISLVSLPDAIRHRGFVEVHSPDSGLRIEAIDVQSLPRPPVSDDRFTTLRGRYQYEAGRRARIAVEPVGGGQLQRGAWVETLQLTSHFGSDGSGAHEAIFTIRNAGLAGFPFRLPPTIGDCRLVVDEAQERSLPNVGGENPSVIPLPDGQRSTTIRLRYSSAAKVVQAWPSGQFVAPIPQTELPVLAQAWTVGLPPGLAATESSALPSKSNRSEVLRRFSFQSLWNVLAGPALAARLALLPQPAGVASTEAAFSGWTVVPLDLPRGKEATVVVYRPVVAITWSLCLALFFAAMVSRTHARLAWIATAAGLLAAVAVVAPLPYAWLLAGISLGSLAGAAGRLVWRPSPNRARQTEGLSSSTQLRLAAGSGSNVIAGLMTTVVFSLAVSRFLHAAAPDAERASDAARRRVVFLVDQNQRPSGDYVFLDPAVYNDLHRLTEVRQTVLPTTLFESARFELLSAPGQRAGVASVDELRAVFDFHTFQSAATVQLPLRRSQILLLEGRARLDGQPVSLAWQPDGMALSLTVDARGKHHLELALGAVARRTPDAVLLDMAIPPAALTTVVLPASGTLVAPDVAPVTIGESRHYRLSHAANLSVRWHTPEASPAAATLEADQLSWWKVRPGSVVLEARFILRPLAGEIRQATIAVDPRLRLLPGQVTSPVARVRVEEGPSNLVKIDLTEPVASEVTFRLAWLWPDASGVGNLNLPIVNLQADQLVRNWTGVSVEPGLELGRIAASEFAPTAAEFMQAWGDASVVPAAVLAGGGEQNREIAVRPVSAAPTAEQSIDWSISIARAKVHCNFQLTGVAPTRFEHRVNVPPQLKITRVTLTQSGRPAAARWTQQPDGPLTVTLLEPPAAEQLLAIDGELALARNRQQFRLPALAAQEVGVTSTLLRVYRQNDVQLQIQSVPAWKARSEAEVGRYRPGLGRLAAALASDSATTQLPNVSRRPNQPRVMGKMFTRASQADGDWRCEARLDLKISDGVLDGLVLSIPDEWSGPLEIDPPFEHTIDFLTGESTRHVAIRPLEAVSGPLSLTLRGPLHNGAAGVQVPDVALVGSAEVERLVLLDRGTAGERIDWETTGLSASGRDALEQLPPDWHDANADLFRVVGRTFDAAARMRQTNAAMPRVHLADLRATLWPARRVSVLARLEIHPAGARNTTFQLATGCRLVQTLVDDVATPCESSGLRSWTVAAPSDVLPYRLTIVYDTFLPAETGPRKRMTLSAPHIVGMEIQQSLWTFCVQDPELPIAGFQTAAMISGNVLLPQPLQAAEVARLDASTRALEDIVAAQSANLPASVLAESFVRWRGAADANARRALKANDHDPRSDGLASRIDAALERIQKVEQRLTQAGIISDEQLLPTPGPPVDEGPVPHLCVIAPGPVGELQLGILPAKASWPTSRGTIAGCIAFVALLLWPVFNIAATRNWLLEHLPFLVGAAGIGWWLVAPLGWLGWPLVLVAVWLSFRTPWPRTTYEPGSTVHRFSNNPSR